MTTSAKEGLHNFTYSKGGRTTDVKIINLKIDDNTHKFKFSYEARNASEDFKGELFDGVKLNHIFDITDLGMTRNSNAYCIFSEEDFKSRITKLTKEGITFIKAMF
jgi:hypothetical protein